MPILAETLDRIREAGDAKRDPELTAIMRRSTAELQASGILDGIVGVGTEAPMFARPNLDHRTTRLSQVLRSGPAVVSFFRGRW